jgi:hypothetical protein
LLCGLSRERFRFSQTSGAHSLLSESRAKSQTRYY